MLLVDIVIVSFLILSKAAASRAELARELRRAMELSARLWSFNFIYAASHHLCASLSPPSLTTTISLICFSLWQKTPDRSSELKRKHPRLSQIALVPFELRLPTNEIDGLNRTSFPILSLSLSLPRHSLCKCFGLSSLLLLCSSDYFVFLHSKISSTSHLHFLPSLSFPILNPSISTNSSPCAQCLR